MTMIHIETTGTVQWLIFQASEGGWVGVCEPLKLTAQGDSQAELAEMVFDITDHLFRDLLAAHKLDRFLRDKGWRIVGGPLPGTPEDLHFEVPIAIIPVPRHAVA